jgi:hypothetical protein
VAPASFTANGARVACEDGAPRFADMRRSPGRSVKTHTRNLDAKLDAHSRGEPIDRARSLGLLAPAARSPAPA